MSTWIVVAALGLYAAALFSVGLRAERGLSDRRHHASVVAALAICVYCTSWTFYGAVGTAARSGWDYLPIFLGPILIFTVGRPIIQRTVALGKGHGATSLPDLLSRRFARSGRLAALVTITAVFFSIPYIALQLTAVASTFAAVTHNPADDSPVIVLSVATTLTIFGIFFGTRNKDITQANRGLVSAMAFESILKLCAFATVATVAYLAIMRAAPEGMPIAPQRSFVFDRFLVLTLLAAAAMLCLPRQFHMTVVEARSDREIMAAGPSVVAYLALFAVLVLPVAAAGSLIAPEASPDLYVLSVPAELGLPWLELFAFVGGFAAASGIVIVAGIALSTMVASDVVLPLLSRGGGQAAFGRVLLVRRLTLCLITAAASAFAIAVRAQGGLAEYGVVSFAGVAQFAPLLLGALYFNRATESGAMAALITGSSCWAVFVLGPAFFEGSPLDWSGASSALLPFLSDTFTRGTVISVFANVGTLAIVSWLTPIGLKAQEDAARFAAMSPSHISNDTVRIEDLRALLTQIIGTQETTELIDVFAPKNDRQQASAGLISAAETKLSRVLGNASANILVSRLLSSGRVEAGDVMILMGNASRELRFGQELLSTTLENLAEGVSVIGADGRLVAWNRAYRSLFAYTDDFLFVGRPVEDLLRHNRPELPPSAIRRRAERLADGREHNHEAQLADGRIVRIQGRPVPGGGYVTSFSDVTEYREAQAAVLRSAKATRFYTDNLPFPIAFSDHEKVLRFHNKAYAEMVEQPGADLTGQTLGDVLGTSYRLREVAVEAVLRGDERRFVLTPSEIGGETTWQVTYVPQTDEAGNATGFFGFYQDISQRRAAQAALEEVNRNLEDRVDQRTSELKVANRELDTARNEAVTANRSKTRFLAAASHDVLQPLNAARLFASSLEDDLPEDSDTADVARKISAAIVSADTLLRSLLNLSKLEAGGVDPNIGRVDLGSFLEGVVTEFRPLAEQKGLSLSSVPTSIAASTDPGLLRSALQNLVSNAVRYTDQGGIVIGVRRLGENVAIDVVDTGRGIADGDVVRIFEEFSRLQRDRDIDGAGLGLATVKRVADILGHTVVVQSELGKGTIFRIVLPRLEPEADQPQRKPVAPSALDGVRVLCVDNDRAVLDALKNRFDRWGAHTEAFSHLDGVRSAYANGRALPDLLILDYQLDDDTTGLDVFDFFAEDKGSIRPAIVVTASRSDETDAAISAKGLPMLAKPVEPAALRALSVSLLNGRTG